MAVRLKLKDGTTREYPVVNPWRKGQVMAKCGAPDCEHPDCATGYARDLGRVCLRIVALMAFIIIFLALFLFLLLPWAGEGGSPGAYDPVRIAFGIAMVINITGTAWYVRMVTRSGAVERELREFCERGTIHGVPARQLSREAGTEGRSRGS